MDLVLQPFIYDNKTCLGIYADKNQALTYEIRKLKDIRWNQLHKCWYLPCTKNHYEKFIQHFQGKANVDEKALYDYIQNWKKNKFGEVKGKMKEPESKIRYVKRVNPAWQKKICRENLDSLQKFKQQLILKSYSPSTIRTYTNELLQFFQSLGRVPARDLDTGRVRDYLQYCFEKLKLSENSLHSRMNALKFFFEQVLGRERFFWEIPRPKKKLLMPHFFNQDEVASIINATRNLKHKCMLMLAYSAGLRVSEVVALKTKHIDSKRMTIFIEQAKGKKDRIVKLSPVLLVMLRAYWREYKPSREGYLFEGQDKAKIYSKRSLQLVLEGAKKKAGILKPGSIHALRHSFATHLLDKGTDVTMIMKLLGHNDIKTTLRYLHVTNRDLMQVMSPLDDLKLNEGLH